jgi:hypothetical protein
MLFWKTAWLRKAESNQAVAGTNPPDQGPLRARLKTTTAPDRYFCQSTELDRATQQLPRSRILLKCLCDLRSGSRGVFEMVRLTLVPLWRKTIRRFRLHRIAGTLKKTPTGNLGLQPGEWVEIKSVVEITQTLDVRGRNRGLLCDDGMCRFSGGRFKVRNRLDRMISEPTGEMRQVQNTVILEGLQCLCCNVFGGCPRQDFMYWREIWLKRVPLEAEGDPRVPHEARASASSVGA